MILRCVVSVRTAYETTCALPLGLNDLDDILFVKDGPPHS